jgi:hypothetical protein
MHSKDDVLIGKNIDKLNYKVKVNFNFIIKAGAFTAGHGG